MTEKEEKDLAEAEYIKNRMALEIVQAVFDRSLSGWNGGYSSEFGIVTMSKMCKVLGLEMKDREILKEKGNRDVEPEEILAKGQRFIQDSNNGFKLEIIAPTADENQMFKVAVVPLPEKGKAVMVVHPYDFETIKKNKENE